jgi:hypothetical protein
VTVPGSIAANSSRRTASHWIQGATSVGEVGVIKWKNNFPDTPMRAVVRCLQKLERV